VDRSLDLTSDCYPSPMVIPKCVLGASPTVGWNSKLLDQSVGISLYRQS